MKTIKFRVWDNIYKCMDEVRDIDFQRKRYQRSGSVHDTEWKYYEELLQFTGFKDRNNKEIYEMDIIHHLIPNTGEMERAKVIYDTELSMFRLSNSRYELFRIKASSLGDCLQEIWHKRTLEVIGNIYENPELL